MRLQNDSYGLYGPVSGRKNLEKFEEIPPGTRLGRNLRTSDAPSETKSYNTTIGVLGSRAPTDTFARRIRCMRRRAWFERETKSIRSNRTDRSVVYIIPTRHPSTPGPSLPGQPGRFIREYIVHRASEDDARWGWGGRDGRSASRGFYFRFGRTTATTTGRTPSSQVMPKTCPNAIHIHFFPSRPVPRTMALQRGISARASRENAPPSSVTAPTTDLFG